MVMNDKHIVDTMGISVGSVHAALTYILGPVVQSIVSLTSSLRVISLTVLANPIYNFALQKLLTFFQQKISAYLRITRYKF